MIFDLENYFRCFSEFLHRAAMLSDVIDTAILSVCASVRPSHAGVVSNRMNIIMTIQIYSQRITPSDDIK